MATSKTTDKPWVAIKRYKRSRRFKPGAVLYRLNEKVTVNVAGFITCTDYVIVASTERAVDHGQPETAVFAANPNGNFFGGFLDDDAEDEEDWTWVEKTDYDSAELEQARVFGKVDHELALRRVLGLEKPDPYYHSKGYRQAVKRWHGQPSNLAAMLGLF